MDDNNPWDIYSRHILKHGGKSSPYLNYENNNFVSDCISLVSDTKCKYNTVNFKTIMAEEKAKKEAKKSVPGIGVIQVDV